MKENKNNKFLVIITVLTIVFTITGGTLAYWNWNTEVNERTNVVFSIGRDFSCAADGGGDITSNDAYLVPTTCTDSEYASANPGAKPRVIKRMVTVTPTISKDGLSINMDLWLDINTIAPELASSRNFRYTLTTEDNSCTDGVVSTGNFYGKADNGRVRILNKSYTRTTEDLEPETYYLYIWLDKAETNSNTMNKGFDFSLGGNCSDYLIEPEAPVLDPGMIPVTIDNDGTVNAVSKYDTSWYNYDEKKWANVVLVNTEATEGVEGSYSREDYLTKIANNENMVVNENDILAYYVWIPRYKYRIPYKKCSEIPEEDRNMDDYPECYAPYTMDESYKPNLIPVIQSYVIEYHGLTDYTLDDAAMGLEKMLKLGGFLLEYDGEKFFMPIMEVLAVYNDLTGINVPVESNGFDENNSIIYMDNMPRSIDILFESATSDISKGDAVDTYYSHPAFIFGEETIPGIWVGKFETSPDPSSTCYTTTNLDNCNNTTQNPRIIPNVSSLRYQDIGNQFKTSLNFANGTMGTDGTVTFAANESNIYGLNTTYTKTDSHMMKNSEWGAVAYLSHSKYGINSGIYVNNSSSYITGRSAGHAGGGFIEYGTYTWLGESISFEGVIGDITDSTLGTKASTTGNVTGIYDMSGGAYEYVMGNYDNTTNSYFSTLPESKYYDVYLPNEDFGKTFCTLETCGGHALYETDDWYNGGVGLVNSDYLWLYRNGRSIFSVGSSNGNVAVNNSWHSVLVVDK